MQLARFAIPHVLIALCAACLHAGGWWPWAFFAGLSALVTLGDRLGPQDRVCLDGANPRVGNALLLFVLPALVALLSLAVYSMVVGAYDRDYTTV